MVQSTGQYNFSLCDVPWVGAHGELPGWLVHQGTLPHLPRWACGTSLWLGLLHKLLGGDEHVDGRQLVVVVPVLRREAHKGLASVLIRR